MRRALALAAVKVFVSHSSRDTNVAERIALALTESGNEVFFDRSSLEPGEAYNEQIREAIAECDLFVFLVSSASIREGTYARSELQFAAKRWRHPSRCVLPVLLEKIPFAEIPPFLAAVTVLEPVGNVVAETAHAVEGLARRARRRVLVRGAGVLALLLLVVGASAWAWSRRSPTTTTSPEGIVVAGDELRRVRRDFLAGGDVYALKCVVSNQSRETRTLLTLGIECDPAALRAEPLEGGAALRDLVLAPGEARTLDLEATFSRAGDGDALYEPQLESGGLARWRFATTVFGAEPVAGPWTEFLPAGSFENGTLRPIAGDEATRVRLAAQSDEGPLDGLPLVLVDPPELWRLTASGKLVRVASLPGRPTALAAGSRCVAVGTEQPDRLCLFAGPTWEPRGPFELVPFAVSDDPEDGETYSVRPGSLAVLADEVWVRTEDADHDPMLSRFVLDNEIHTIPFPSGWAEARLEISNACRGGLTLRTIGDEVFGITSQQTPGYVYGTDEELRTYSGHEIELVSCASDIAPAPGGGLLLVDCDNNLVRTEVRGETIEEVQRLGQLAVPDPRPRTWEAQRISVCRGRVLIAVSLFEQEPSFRASSTRMFTWTRDQGLRTLAVLDDCETTSLATLDDLGFAVLRTADGRWESVLVDYPKD